MKKYIPIMAAGLFALSTCLTGCGSSSSVGSSNDKIQIVTTIFPEYDWVKQIVGDNENVEVTILINNGVDIHSYQPTVDDIIKISTCDLFVYVGGESDSWVSDALAESTNSDMKVVNLLEILGDAAKEEEIIEGMESEDEHDHAKDEHGDSEEVEYDEHVWLSLKNAALFCNEITDVLSDIDSENADSYKANLAAYSDKISALDKQYQDAVDSAAQTTILFGDRFPFRYLVDDYGIDYFAAFAGCSAETEASFETITFLAGKVNELDIDVIFTIDNSDKRIAETIINNTDSKDQTVKSLISMQSITADDVKEGITYLSVMEDNLSLLKEAFHY